MPSYGRPYYDQTFKYTTPRKGWSLLSPFRSTTSQNKTRYQDDLLLSYQQSFSQDTKALRQRVQQQDAEIQQLRAELDNETGSDTEAAERWNFLAFKYNLLIDMWALRVLDNEELGARREIASAGTSDRILDLRASGWRR